MATSDMLNSFLVIIIISLVLYSESSSAANLSFNSSASSTAHNSHFSSLRSVCKTTPYPDECFESLKLTISININPNILTHLLQSLQIAISEVGKLSDLLVRAQGNIIERQKGTIQDCNELHHITMSSLQRAASRIHSTSPNNNKADAMKLADARTFLSAALTNKNTCLEGLDSASGPLQPILVTSLDKAYKFVSNALSMLSSSLGGESEAPTPSISSSGDGYDPSEVITVAADGTGNFTTITDAINFAPNNSYDRTIIYLRQGVYEENVEVPSYKTNIVLVGDGSDVTVITGNRSVYDGWTTFRSATVAISGEGFLARDITFENSAGPEKHQAVAVRVNADLAAFYRCTFNGYQDTLYVHSFRQFYRECDIFGTIDFIFGNAAVVVQASNLVVKLPMPGQFTVITAQSRDSPDEDTGISIQNCSILATDDLYSNSGSVKSYLGRPWRPYSRTVYLESYIDQFIDPAGWIRWSGDEGLDSLYYGEYDNYGPGSDTQSRVDWAGYHVMDYYDASNFTVSEFITGDEWLDSTSFPYDEGV